MAATPDFSGYAFISIGANLPSGAGDPIDTIMAVFSKLEHLSRDEILRSSIYMTSPVDSPAGTPDFYNAMAGIIPEDKETPISLLHKLQAMEDAAGRTRSGIRNEARTLDLDLVLFGAHSVDTAELTLPHPRATSRKFVMEPLAELAGNDFEFPGTAMTVADIMDGIGGQSVQKLGK